MIAKPQPGVGRLARLLPLLWAAACGSINAVTSDGGTGGGAAGTSGTAGTAGTAGTSGAAGTGAGGTNTGGGGRGGTGGVDVTGIGGGVGKDAGSTDAANPDVNPSECMPGERMCDQATPMTCLANGTWQRGATCTNVCSGGSCVGTCNPGSKMCVGNLPQFCDSQGLWQPAPACTYVCRQGDCTGVCMPGARQCSSSGVPQSCNADGMWENSAACPFVCSQGACVGECKPGQTDCSNNAPQTCNSAGQWQSGQACQFVCTNGACAGSCTPGAHQCADGVPQTCTNGGTWQSGSACQFVCANGGCSGSCVPGDTRCSGAQKQTCDATGAWQNTASPPVQLLMNPGFDAGHTAWVEKTPASTAIITPESSLMTVRAETPSYLAWLAGYPNANDDLSQTITIPAGASSITLSFYYLIQTQETSIANPDAMDVYTYDAATSMYTTIASFNDNMPTPSWTRFQTTLPSTLAGKTIKFGFQAVTDMPKTTNFFVDSVSLTATACGP